MDKETLNQLLEIFKREWIREQKDADKLVQGKASKHIAAYNIGHADGIGKAMRMIETYAQSNG